MGFFALGYAPGPGYVETSPTPRGSPNFSLPPNEKRGAPRMVEMCDSPGFLSLWYAPGPGIALALATAAISRSPRMPVPNAAAKKRSGAGDGRERKCMAGRESGKRRGQREGSTAVERVRCRREAWSAAIRWDGSSSGANITHMTNNMVAQHQQSKGGSLAGTALLRRVDTGKESLDSCPLIGAPHSRTPPGFLIVDST
jgi:hypothetical protein